LPLVRQALLLHQEKNDTACIAKLHEAMALSQGRRRANIAFLGARVALETYLVGHAASVPDSVATPATCPPENALPTVQNFLTDCLTHDAGHPHALWCLAAVRWLNGDSAALAGQAPQMANADVADLRYHYLGALCHLLASDFQAVLAACERI